MLTTTLCIEELCENEILDRPVNLAGAEENFVGTPIEAIAKNITLSVRDLIEAFTLIANIRELESRIGAAYRAPRPELKIRGFCHLCVGQEAIYGGLFLTKREEDSVITAYRAHGAMLACDTKSGASIFAELAGKETGCSMGMGGSMHIFSPQHGFYGGHGIVGASASLGTGISFAKKYQEESGVCFCFMGDGAANQGQFFESMNMAKLWKLPIVYCIENNGYAMGTSLARSTGEVDLSKRGESLGIPGFKVNGMNVLESYLALEASRSWVKENDSPILMELVTYRYVGHSMSDPGKYRSRDELNFYRKNKDAIDATKIILIECGVKESLLNLIIEKSEQLAIDAEKFAISSKYPDKSLIEKFKIQL